MDFGYKCLIATVLVCAAWCKGKSRTTLDDKVKADSSIVVDQNGDSVQSDSRTYQLKPRDVRRKPNEIDDRGIARPDNDDDANDLDSINDVPDVRDSVAIDKVCKSVQDLEYEAVRLIAMSESIEMNAYYDRAAGKWTIGFGNITHPDGTPVRKGDKIENEEQLMYYFRSFFSDRVAPNIVKYLPNWDKFNRQEKLALLDLFWNAGSGKLHTPARNPKTKKQQPVKPSEFANALNAYAENRTPENLKAVTDIMKSRQFISTKKKGIIPALQKRVAFRIKVFTGEIQLNGEGPTSINLDEAHIGAHYGAFKASDLYNLDFSQSKLEIICDSINNCKSGRNFADTLEYKKVHDNKVNKTQTRARRQPQRRTTPQRRSRYR
ncbi:MAG: hypothetical protein IJ532_03080 [Alphaproteobacteria bacterium]|nr:hypothetical protein [Alphaproteobacteria bacterium]